jgi:putative membrane protein
VTIFVVTNFFGLIDVDKPSTLVLSALLLGVLNAWIRPILILITLPISLFTFGLFILVINTFLLKLTDLLVPGFEVEGLLRAFIASILISIISLLLNSLITDRRRFRRSE